MSAPRRRHSLAWTDQAGNAYADHWHTKAAVSLGSIPRTARLVDVHDPADHLIAVLVPNGPADPLVLVPAAHRPTPMLALCDAGLVAVLVSFDGPDGPTVGYLGTPQPSFDIDCRTCARSFTLPAQALGDRVRTATRRTPLLRLA